MTNQERLRKELEIQKANLFGVYNHCRAVAVREDYAEVALDIVPESLNFQGIVHGAAYYTNGGYMLGNGVQDRRQEVCDPAGKCSIPPRGGGRNPDSPGTTIHRGRTSCLVEIRITNEEEKLMFIGTFLFHCINT